MPNSVGLKKLYTLWLHLMGKRSLGQGNQFFSKKNVYNKCQGTKEKVDEASLVPLLLLAAAAGWQGLQANSRAGEGMGLEAQVLEEKIQTQHGLAQRVLQQRSGQASALVVVEPREVYVQCGTFCLLGQGFVGPTLEGAGLVVTLLFLLVVV